jgi:predicted transcriptional regulator
MPDDLAGQLSRRERQIMDILFEAQEASAADVHRLLPDPPSYTSVRTLLGILEEKGWVTHREEGRRYVYRPRRSPAKEGRSALSRVLKIFYGGSLEQALAAHLSDPGRGPSEEELQRLRELIDEAESSQRRKSHGGK